MGTNPSLSRLDEYEKLSDDSGRYMSVQGTMLNLFILGILLLIPATISWHWFTLGYMDKINIANIVGIIASLILSFIMIFNPKTSPYLAPLYAVAEGTLLGSLSAIFEAHFPHIVIQAVAATFMTLFATVALYKTGLIKVTQKFISVVLISLFAIFSLYILELITSWFGYTGISNLLWSSSILSIGISCVVIVVAAASLIIDIDRIERFSNAQAPSYMNWYCAFGLLLTLVWLYLEFLRLLAKFNSRR